MTPWKPLTVNHNKLWKIIQEMGIPDHLTYLLRNLYSGKEATGHVQWTCPSGFKLGKEYVKEVYCHPSYLTYRQSTSWVHPAELDEAQAGFKTAGRNINNLRYTDDTTLTEESEEELKSLLMKAECQTIDAFELWYWRRLMRVPWPAWRSNQSILKEISPE